MSDRYVNLTIKCRALTHVGAGLFREPEISIACDDVDLYELFLQEDAYKFLFYVGDNEIIDYLEGKGYSVEEIDCEQRD